MQSKKEEGKQMAREEKIQELLNLSGIQDSNREIASYVGCTAPYKHVQNALKEFIGGDIDLLDVEINEVLEDLFARSFADFSDKEIDELLAFFSSDLGKKFVKIKAQRGAFIREIILRWKKGD